MHIYSICISLSVSSNRTINGNLLPWNPVELIKNDYLGELAKGKKSLHLAIKYLYRPGMENFSDVTYQKLPDFLSCVPLNYENIYVYKYNL